jgi:hypothetical protein
VPSGRGCSRGLTCVGSDLLRIFFRIHTFVNAGDIQADVLGVDGKTLSVEGVRISHLLIVHGPELFREANNLGGTYGREIRRSLELFSNDLCERRFEHALAIRRDV